MEDGDPVAFSVKKTDDMDCFRLIINDIESKVIVDGDHSDSPGGLNLCFPDTQHGGPECFFRERAGQESG